MSNEDRTFKVKFNSIQSKPIKVKLNKVESVVDVKGEFDSKPAEDIYYDEIVYYDGGGVDGWL